MRCIFVIALFGWLCPFPTSHANPEPRILNFSEFDVEEFKAEIENYDVIAIAFYAPYCAQCVEFLKSFQDAYRTVLSGKMKKSDDLNNETGDIYVAKLDCTTATGNKVCDHYHISGYPTVKLFRFGSDYLDYDSGPLEYGHVLEWMRRHFANPSRRYNSFPEMNRKLQTFTEPIVIGVFKNSKQNVETLNDWMKAAGSLRSQWNFRDVSFYHIFADYAKGALSDLTELGVNGASKVRLPLIVIHKPDWLLSEHEKNNVLYDLDGKEDFEKWLKRKIFGSLAWRTRETADDIKPPLIVAYYDFNFKERRQFSHFWRDRILMVSNDYPDVTFAISSSLVFRKQLRRQGLPIPREDNPPLIMAKDTFGGEYVMRKQYTDANFRDFVDKFRAGKLKPFIGTLRAQKEVANDDPTVAKVVVSSNFPKMVTNSAKDVLVMFYANWCKHSQAVMPLYDALAATFANEPNLDVVKMDLDLNETPSTFTVDLFPTLYFIPAHTKQKIKYEQGPQIHSLVQFVTKHASFELKYFDRKGLPRKAIDLHDPNVRSEEDVLVSASAASEFVQSDPVRNEL